MDLKVKNTVKMWHEKGYTIEGYSIRYFAKNDYAEYGLSFTKHGNEEVSFEAEWITIKSLAARQGFYVMPVTHLNQNGHAEILLVNKKSVREVRLDFRDLQEEMMKSYWYLQGDEAFVENIAHMKQLEGMIQAIERDIRVMGNYASNNDLFKELDYPTFKTWMTYKTELNSLNYALMDDERCPEEAKAGVERILELYRL